MGQPKSLDKYEAAAVLSPLVWPMLADDAKVSGPLACNMATSGVSIAYAQHQATLNTVQYELFRTEVLLYFLENYYMKPISKVLGIAEINRLVEERILAVFENQ